MSTTLETKLAHLEAGISQLIARTNELLEQNKVLEAQCQRMTEEKEALQLKHEHSHEHSNELLEQNKVLEAQCQRMTEEKEALQLKHERWLAEKARLVHNSELTRGKLEAILGRLKSLDRCA